MDKLISSPKISVNRLNSINPKEAAFIKDNMKRGPKRKSTKSLKIVPHLNRSTCEKLISKESHNALAGGYDIKCSFLNEISDIIMNTVPESLNDSGFFELLCELVLEFLSCDYPAVRAMCFQLLRLCTFTERNLVFMLTTHVDIYVVRALDLRVENDMEREEAIQLITAMMSVYENSNLKKLIESSAAQKSGKKFAFPKSIMQPVISIALKAINTPKIKENVELSDGSKAEESDSDRLSLPCVGAFLEFCVLEPELILEMAGTDWMVRVLTGSSSVSRRIAAVVGRVLVTWLDDPKLRAKANLHLVLEQIFAPLVEFGFFQKNLANTEQGDKIVEAAMDNFSHSFLSILRSWSGLFACAAVGPNSTVIASSPLRLLEYLGLGTVGNANLSRIRDMIVDICCDFMDLPYASREFESWSHAIQFYATINTPDEFKCSLKDDFVLAHCDMLLACDTEYSNHVDLLASFRSLAGFILINAGLPQSLSRLILSQPDSPSGLKAMLFMSDILRTAPSVVPSGWRAAILSMPTLVQSACESLAQSKAAAATHGYYDSEMVEKYTYLHSGNAEMVLHRFDLLNKIWINNATLRPSPDSNYSLFLHPPEIDTSPFYRQNDDLSIQSLIDNILSKDEVDWSSTATLFSLLEADTDPTKKSPYIDYIEDIVDKVLSVVSPSRGAQCGWIQNRTPIVVAKQVISVAMELATEHGKCMELLMTYASECRNALEKNNLPTGLFSIKSLVYGGSMYHFSLIGTFSTHPVGMSLLERTGILQIFIDLMVPTTGVEYVKLVISCLDYGSEQYLPRVILQKALTSTNEVSRRWSTRFLSVLASFHLPDFSEWGIRLLLGQLGDESVKVIRHAIRILHIWLPTYPNAARWLRTAQLDSFGDAGVLLKAHSYTDENVCTLDVNAVREAVRYWMETFNVRYMQSIDDDVRVVLLSVGRSLDGGFSRSSGERPEHFGLRAPVHLFASLARHNQGRIILREERVTEELVLQLTDEFHPLVIKGALVALGQLGGIEQGFRLLSPDVVPRMIRLAEEAPVLSIRGVAFWALNMLGSSENGALALAQLGWESNRHRHVVDKVRKEEAQSTEDFPDFRRATHTPVPEIAMDRHCGCLWTESSPFAETRKRCRSAIDILAETGNSRSRLRRTKSDIILRIKHECTKEFPIESNETNAGSRIERTMTGESCPTSGLGSLVEDSIGSRRRTVTIGSLADEWGMRSRTSTIAQCLSQGLVASRSQLEVHGAVVDMMRTPHFSTLNRERWRLAPLRMRRFLQVNRNIGDPVRYIFMSKDEESNLSEYRRVLLSDSWLFDELRKAELDMSRVHSVHAVHTIALPAEVEIMCTNIFPTRSRPDPLIYSQPAMDCVHVVEDRGAKSGHGRSQRTDASITHSAYRCFYCSSENKREEFVVPTDVDVAYLRKEVLNQVDMLEIKQAVPERKLISLRRAHRWLFEWPCLYADVLELLDEYRFKPRSRAFLQEIFYHALKL